MATMVIEHNPKKHVLIGGKRTPIIIIMNVEINKAIETIVVDGTEVLFPRKSRLIPFLKVIFTRSEER
jgi:hypothetical protein